MDVDILDITSDSPKQSKKGIKTGWPMLKRWQNPDTDIL